MKVSKERYINLCKHKLEMNKFDISLGIINSTLCLFLYVVALIIICSGYRRNDIPLYAVVIGLILFSVFCGCCTIIIIRFTKLIIERKELKYKLFLAENDEIISSTLENEYSEDNNGDSLE